MKFYERVINDFGGYEKCKDILSQPNIGFIMNAQAMRRHMLEYRRQHNIFEIGDLYVFTEKYSKQSVIHKVDSLNSGKGCIRHATPEEIKAGRRL